MTGTVDDQTYALDITMDVSWDPNGVRGAGCGRVISCTLAAVHLIGAAALEYFSPAVRPSRFLASVQRCDDVGGHVWKLITLPAPGPRTPFGSHPRPSRRAAMCPGSRSRPVGNFTLSLTVTTRRGRGRFGQCPPSPAPVCPPTPDLRPFNGIVWMRHDPKRRSIACVRGPTVSRVSPRQWR